MPKDRWTSGLAAAVSNGAPGCSCISNDRADMIEELINSCAALNALLEILGDVFPSAKINTALSVQDFRLALSRAKNWK